MVHRVMPLAWDPMGIESDRDEASGLDEDDTYSVWSPQSPRESRLESSLQQNKTGSQQHTSSYVGNTKIKADLCAAKAAGFKVGVIGQVLDRGMGAYVTISCRISKLGISEEAMQAWNLDKDQYFILLLHYPEFYVTTHRLISDPHRGKESLKLWACASSNYKLTTSQCIAAFATKKNDQNNGQQRNVTRDEKRDALEDEKFSMTSLFIEGPLTQLLNERFIPILRTRNCFNFGWEGAEKYYNDQQGKDAAGEDISEAYFKERPCKVRLSPLVSEDHIGSMKSPHDMSLPLIAMQFVLRHFVRCTEFCLVCHCRVEDDFEALKPYVCSRPLCLYQYMSLGLGPSIEYEIMSQPDVVDVLISFCFASAHANRLNDFPTGMNLLVLSQGRTGLPIAPCAADRRVPATTKSYIESPLASPRIKILDGFANSTLYSCKYDPLTCEAVFDPEIRISLQTK